jgi:hypothetical protein
VELADNLAAQLRALVDAAPENPHVDNGPWDFVTRAPSDVIEARVRPVLHELAGDAHARVAARAIDVLMQLPTAAGTIARLLALAPKLRGDPRALAAHALANWCYGSGREADIARVLADFARASDALPPAPVAIVLGVRAPDAALAVVARHAGPGAETFCTDVASMLARFHPERVLDACRAMRALPAPGKQQVLAQLEGDLALDAATRARLAATYGLPAPAGAPPTLDACRAALGA